VNVTDVPAVTVDGVASEETTTGGDAAPATEVGTIAIADTTSTSAATVLILPTAVRRKLATR
jgi:hypothetical protein